MRVKLLHARFLRTWSCSWSFGSLFPEVELWPHWLRCCGSAESVARPLLVHYSTVSRTEDAPKWFDYGSIFIIFPCLVERSLRLVGEFVPSLTGAAFQGHFCIAGKFALASAISLTNFWSFFGKLKIVARVGCVEWVEMCLFSDFPSFTIAAGRSLPIFARL